MTEFLQTFEEVVGASGFRFIPSPSELLTAWRQFVSDCERGYFYGLDEYYNDLSIRDLIEVVLTSQELRRFPELEALRSAVESTDCDFKALLRQDVAVGSDAASWWQRGVLAKAGSEYVKDVQESFGVTIASSE